MILSHCTKFIGCKCIFSEEFPVTQSPSLEAASVKCFLCVLPEIFFASMSAGVVTLQDSPIDPNDPCPCILPSPSVWADLTDSLLMNRRQW